MRKEEKSQLSETVEKKSNSTKQRGIARDDSYIPGAPKLSKRFHIEARKQHTRAKHWPCVSTVSV